MTTPTIHPEHLSLSERISRDVAAWRASGKEIERLPPGQCNWDQLSNRQKINPQVDHQNREAQRQVEGKAAKGSQARSAPRAVAPKPTLKPRRAKPAPKPAPVGKAPRKRLSTAERAARRGLGRGKRPIKSNQVLALLAEKGPMRCRDIMAALGWEMNPTNQMLWALKNRELLISTGGRGSMKFDLAPVKAKP